MHRCFCVSTEKSVIIRAYLIKSPKYHCIWKYFAPVAVTLTHSELAASYGAKGSTYFKPVRPYLLCLPSKLASCGVSLGAEV